MTDFISILLMTTVCGCLLLLLIYILVILAEKRQATVDNKKRYHNPRNGEMTSKDFEKAKEYVNKVKEKHLDKKKEAKR